MISLSTKNNFKNQELLKLSIYRGGNMNGNSHRISLSAEDDKVRLIYSDSDRHDKEPEIKEYIVDSSVLNVVKEIFLEEGMYKWNGKKFSKLFIYDGATTSYSFEFANDSVDFSSQIFPSKYKEKLARLSTVIENYRKFGVEITAGIASSSDTACAVDANNTSDITCADHIAGAYNSTHAADITDASCATNTSVETVPDSNRPSPPEKAGIAKKSDWNTKEMPEKCGTLILERTFSQEQMIALRSGNIPQEMEDKWFWYMEGDRLYAHRSWTGLCVYIIDFRSDGKHIVTVNRDSNQYQYGTDAEELERLNKLLDWWEESSYDHYGEWISETADALGIDMVAPI